MKKEITSSYIFCFLLVLSAILFQSCDSNSDDPTANLPVCDCIELQPQRDALGEKINGRGHIMYLKDSLYTGKCVAYHLDNTTKKVELIFQNGLLNGKQQVWDDKGNRVLEVPMSQGKFHGTLMEWDDKQQLVSKINLKDGAIIDFGYYKMKENEFNIYYAEKGLNFGFPYISWFEKDKGFARDIAGDTYFRGLIQINYYEHYILDISSSWDKVKPHLNQFKQILLDFHENNPNETIKIETCKIEGNLLRGPDLYHGKGFPKERQIPKDFFDLCESLEKYKFLKFSENLKKLLENAK